jgi:hypothetical protein
MEREARLISLLASLVDRTFSGDSPYTLQKAVVDFATSGNNTIIASPGADYKIRIYKICLIADFAVTSKLTYYSGTDALSGAMQVDTLIDDFTGGLYLDCGANKAFIINSSNPGQISGYVMYRLVAV